MKKIFILLGVGFLFLGGIYVFSVLSISSFKECAKAGYQILESYPAQCKTPDGRTFTQQLVSEQNPQGTNTEQLSTFTSDTVVFQHPKAWNPTLRDSSPGAIGQTIHLGIPDVESDQEASFTTLGITELHSNDIASQEELIIGDRTWMKWIRKGEGYTSYDYYTAMEEERSFGIHVTVGEENEDLEQQLDSLVHSLTFK